MLDGRLLTLRLALPLERGPRSRPALAILSSARWVTSSLQVCQPWEVVACSVLTLQFPVRAVWAAPANWDPCSLLRCRTKCRPTRETMPNKRIDLAKLVCQRRPRPPRLRSPLLVQFRLIWRLMMCLSQAKPQDSRQAPPARFPRPSSGPWSCQTVCVGFTVIRREAFKVLGPVLKCTTGSRPASSALICKSRSLKIRNLSLWPSWCDALGTRVNLSWCLKLGFPMDLIRTLRHGGSRLPRRALPNRLSRVVSQALVLP